MNSLIEILLLFIVVLSIDYVYLTLNHDYFRSLITTIQKTNFKFDYIGAVIAYVCITLLLYVFIIMSELSLLHAFILGVLTYGVYHGTNYACFKKWPMNLIIMDSIWGGILFVSSSLITRSIINMNK